MSEQNGRLLKMMNPEQITTTWPALSYYIESALPEISKGDAFWKGNMLKSLTSGKMGCWVGYVKKEPRLFITCGIVTDEISKCKSFLIYSYTVKEGISPQDFKWGIEELKKFAKSQGCKKIVAVTRLESLKKAFEFVGGTSSYSLEMEV